MNRLKSKKTRKKEETAAAAAAAAAPEAAAGAGGKENDSSTTSKTKKKGGSTAGANEDIVEKKKKGKAEAKNDTTTATTKKAKNDKKDKSKKSKDKDADGGDGGKKEGSKKSKKDKSKKSADGAAATTKSESKSKSGGGKKKDSGSGGSKKLSAQTLAMHKKWQDAATDLGGGKIIINKTEAKKAIFDMLHDAFCPMNITQIHTSLKGIVPSPVLKSCLEEMVIDTAGGDEGSDDEDDKPKKSKKSNKKGGDGGGGNGGDPSTTNYVDSLRIKSGRNANNVLYFTNHDKSVNGGNGLPPDERNELIGAEQKSAQDLQVSRDNLKAVQNLTTKLLSEPTNQEANDRIAKEEKVLADLKASLEESRQYAGNEKKREQTKKRIRDLADVWWKRRRMCNDFLQGMEDATEGTISVKKCLSGDGQIDIDSDEAIIAAEREMYEMRKAKKAKKKHSGDGLPPTSNFIGVQFTSTAKVERVYA